MKENKNTRKSIIAILLVVMMAVAGVFVPTLPSTFAEEPGGDVANDPLTSTDLPLNEPYEPTTHYVDSIDETGVKETSGDSWTAIITIDTGTNFDIYAWWNQDITGVYSWDPEHKPVSEVKSVSMQVIAWDVDNPSGTPPPTSWETDLVHLNDHYLGVLAGPDQGTASTPIGTGGWVTTTFILTETQIDAIFSTASYPFALTPYINVDSQHTEMWWGVAVDKIIITIEYESIGVIITQPISGETFWIEAESEPNMPEINCQAKVVGIAPDPTATTEFSWEATIEYTEYGRDDSTTLYGERILGGSWTPDFRNVIAGGEMEITTKAIIDGEQYQYSVIIYIRGNNPNEATVKEELGQLILQAISYRETWPGHHWLQFHPESDPRWGLPEHERGIEVGGGWGLMQITWQPTPADIWNWKGNIKSGKETYKHGEFFSRECVEYFKDQYPQDKTKIKLSRNQHQEQACHYYNRGRLHGYYWRWNPESKIWIINPDVPRDPETGLTYAQDVMRIVSLVKSGSPPDGWGLIIGVDD